MEDRVKARLLGEEVCPLFADLRDAFPVSTRWHWSLNGTEERYFPRQPLWTHHDVTCVDLTVKVEEEEVQLTQEDFDIVAMIGRSREDDWMASPLTTLSDLPEDYQGINEDIDLE